MTGARTLSGAEREPPLSPPDHDDPPSLRLRAADYDAAAGDWLRSLHGGRYVEAFDLWLETHRPCIRGKTGEKGGMSENSGMTDSQVALDSLDDYARMAGVEAIGPLAVLRGVIADRDRLAAEVLRLTDAVMESDARGARMQAERDAIAKAAHDLMIQANSVEYCYRRRPENFAVALQCMADDCEAMRIALSPATSTGSEVGK